MHIKADNSTGQERLFSHLLPILCLHLYWLLNSGSTFWVFLYRVITSTMSTLCERLKELTEKSSKFIHVGKYTCKLQYHFESSIICICHPCMMVSSGCLVQSVLIVSPIYKYLQNTFTLCSGRRKTPTVWYLSPRLLEKRNHQLGRWLRSRKDRKLTLERLWLSGKKTDIEKQLIEMEGVEDAANEMHGKYSIFVVYM